MRHTPARLVFLCTAITCSYPIEKVVAQEPCANKHIDTSANGECIADPTEDPVQILYPGKHDHTNSTMSALPKAQLFLHKAREYVRRSNVVGAEIPPMKLGDTIDGLQKHLLPTYSIRCNMFGVVGKMAIEGAVKDFFMKSYPYVKWTILGTDGKPLDAATGNGTGVPATEEESLKMAQAAAERATGAAAEAPELGGFQFVTPALLALWRQKVGEDAAANISATWGGPDGDGKEYGKMTAEEKERFESEILGKKAVAFWFRREYRKAKLDLSGAEDEVWAVDGAEWLLFDDDGRIDRIEYMEKPTEPVKVG